MVTCFELTLVSFIIPIQTWHKNISQKHPDMLAKRPLLLNAISRKIVYENLGVLDMRNGARVFIRVAVNFLHPNYRIGLTVAKAQLRCCCWEGCGHDIMSRVKY